jgi:Zn-finger nucleic acid-binding protein
MTAYREQMRMCPACGTAMDAVPVSADPNDASVRAEADICAKCGGIFLEFFDGEPSAISRGMIKRRELDRKGAAHEGALTCPDCDSPMVRKAYLGQGPSLARCEQCMAAFLAPDEVAVLARLELAPEIAHVEPSWLGRLLSWLPGVQRED